MKVIGAIGLLVLTQTVLGQLGIGGVSTYEYDVKDLKRSISNISTQHERMMVNQARMEERLLIQDQVLNKLTALVENPDWSSRGAERSNNKISQEVNLLETRVNELHQLHQKIDKLMWGFLGSLGLYASKQIFDLIIKRRRARRAHR